MLAFNGSSDFLTLPIVPDVTGFNLAFWLTKRNFTNNARVFDCQDSGPANGFTVVELANGKTEFVNRNGAGPTCAMDSVRNINGELCHYVFTFDGTIAKLYENGVLIAQDTSAVMGAFAATVLTIGKRTGGSNYWNGKLGELVFQNSTTPWTQAQITDLYYNGVIPSGSSYWLFEGNVLDGSGNGKHGTLTGGTYVDMDRPRVAASGRTLVRDFNTSLAFNGTTTGVTLPVAAPSTGFSISFRLRVRVFTANNRIIDFQDAGPTHGFTVVQPTTPARTIRFDIYNGAGNVANVESRELKTGRFYHFVATFEPNNVKLYQDGVLVNSDASAVMSQPAASITLGKRAVSASNYFNGWLNEVVFFGRALTQEEITAIYLGGLFPSDKSAEYLFKNNLNDTSGNGKHGTGTGTIDYVGYKPGEARRPISMISSKALDFGPVTTSVVTVADAPILRPETTKAFTFVATFRLLSVENNVLPRIIGKGSHYLCFMGDMTNGKRRRLAVEVADGLAVASEYWGSTELSLKKWYTVVATFDNGTCRMWLNGAEESIAYIGGPFNGVLEPTVGLNILIGNSAGGNRPPKGQIAKVAYSTRAFTEEEAINACNTGVLPADIIGKWNFDEGSGNPQDTSGNGNHGVNSGAVWREYVNTRAAV